jgi:GNAT superfamily N-acetyltransferase
MKEESSNFVGSSLNVKKIILGQKVISVSLSKIVNDDVSFFATCDDSNGSSDFYFSAFQTGCNIRLNLQCEISSNMKDIIFNTSLRLPKHANPKKRTRKRKSLIYEPIVYLDQLHVIKEFQGKGFGTKLIAILITWLSFEFPNIRSLIVVSPSNKGKPFYLKLGAQKQITSQNLVFDIQRT